MGHVIITGASRGIGRALALRFAARGDALVLTARAKAELDSLAAEITTKYQRESVVVAADLGAPEGIAALEAACAPLTITGLVNNAGFGTAGTFETCDREKERGMIRLNVEAVVELCHAFLPKLKGQKDAFIMNVASTAAFQAVPLFATYSATKAFVLSLSEALAEELAPEGIHVMALCPGATHTGFQSEANVETPGAATVDDLADYAMRALAAKQRVAIHGAMNNMQVFSARFAPRFLVAKIAKKTIEPWVSKRK